MKTANKLGQVCTRTVMDTSDPDIWFDDDGVSSHALRYDRLISDTVRRAQSGERQQELLTLVRNIKEAGKNKPYDCVIGVSGGVDSSYVVLQAVKLGLRPLAVHFDSGWNSELAVSNIESIVSSLSLDLFTDVVDWREMRDLQLSFFKASVANCDIPTDHAFPSVAYKQAAKYGIKYVISGSNLQTESVLPQAWGYNSADATHLKAIQRRFGTVKLRTYPIMGSFRRYVWYPKVRGISRVNLLNYMPYVTDNAKTQITDELGWRDYGGKHYESVFTRYFQGYYLPTKFGFDKRRAHLSSLVLSGQMSRDEALGALEKSNYDETLRAQDEQFIAKKLGISAESFRAICAQAPIGHMKYPNSKKLLDFAIKVRKPLLKGSP